MPQRKLADLIDMSSSQAVLEEVLLIAGLISSRIDTHIIRSAFQRTQALFEGRYPGKQACNTGFHDFRHTTDTLLATMRLLHGAALHQQIGTHREIYLVLSAALLHDTGYIQEVSDAVGTGAKYTTIHVSRSMVFVGAHGSRFDLSNEELHFVQTLIRSTDITVDMEQVRFKQPNHRMLGQILATADIMAQMADRIYLEKLIFLYREFQEAGIGDYTDEVDFLRKTIGFYDTMQQRMAEHLGNVGHLMCLHFQTRWQIDENLYAVAMRNHKQYLLKLIQTPHLDPLKMLRREGIVHQAMARSRPHMGGV